MTDTKRTSRTLPLTKQLGALFAASFFLASCSDEQTARNEDPCVASIETAKKLDDSIGGDVAAFIIAEQPHSLTDIAFTDKDGTAKTIADFAGKTTFINLWATWCAPCRAEMPSIERMTKQAASDKFAVVPISVDKGGDGKPKTFYDEIGLTSLPFYHDGTFAAFNSFKKKSLALGLPATVIVNKNGCVLGKLNGPAEWDSPDAIKLINAAIALD